jgi:hypothetical protein
VARRVIDHVRERLQVERPLTEAMRRHLQQVAGHAQVGPIEIAGGWADDLQRSDRVGQRQVGEFVQH